eukprot:6209361-Pleurochrysis_carterae.AAC.1
MRCLQYQEPECRTLHKRQAGTWRGRRRQEGWDQEKHAIRPELRKRERGQEHERESERRGHVLAGESLAGESERAARQRACQGESGRVWLCACAREGAARGREKEKESAQEERRRAGRANLYTTHAFWCLESFTIAELMTWMVVTYSPWIRLRRTRSLYCTYCVDEQDGALNPEAY